MENHKKKRIEEGNQYERNQRVYQKETLASLEELETTLFKVFCQTEIETNPKKEYKKP